MNAAYLSVHLLTANIWDVFVERTKLRQAQTEGGNRLLVLARFSRPGSFCLCLSCFPDFSAILYLLAKLKGNFSQLAALPLSILLCDFSIDRVQCFLLKSFSLLIGCVDLSIVPFVIFGECLLYTDRLCVSDHPA